MRQGEPMATNGEMENFSHDQTQILNKILRHSSPFAAIGSPTWFQPLVYFSTMFWFQPLLGFDPITWFQLSLWFHHYK